MFHQQKLKIIIYFKAFYKTKGHFLHKVFYLLGKPCLQNTPSTPNNTSRALVIFLVIVPAKPHVGDRVFKDNGIRKHSVYTEAKTRTHKNTDTA